MNQFSDFTLSEFAGQTNSSHPSVKIRRTPWAFWKEARQRIKVLGPIYFYPKKKSSNQRSATSFQKNPLVILLVIATAPSYTFGGAIQCNHYFGHDNNQRTYWLLPGKWCPKCWWKTETNYQNQSDCYPGRSSKRNIHRRVMPGRYYFIECW